MKKIFDSWNLNYKKPFGAIKKGEACEFRIRLPKSTVLDFPPVPVLVVFRTGFKETFLSMNLECEEGEQNVYQATYVPKHSGVHYYYFSYKQNGTRNYIKKVACHESCINNGELFQLTVYDDKYETPDFLKGGIMYQIFPDRFYKSTKIHENVPKDRIIRENWEDTPYYKPDENGHVWNNDYFGGDLEGIKEKLPYLKGLGVTCIYLNPIFESHENHRYNTANYRKVDPLLGTNEDFRTLCDEAKKYGISIILDGVFSHTGADSIYFNKFNRYNSVGAYNSKDSEFFPWYTFYEYPDKYEAWWGIDTLPNVQENNKEYTEYICGNGGVLDYWISLGAAGYRLDVADELPDEFLDNLNKCVKKHGKEKIIIGEVWEDASNKESYGVKRRYLLGDQLDSVMNYPFRSAIMNYVMGGSSFEFKNSIMTILENYPKPSVDVLMNSISTHDIERAINVLGGESCEGKDKDWMCNRWLTNEEYELGRNRMKCAMALQYFLPGVPCIYYGDEAGVQGYKDPFNRRCYPWGKEDKELIEYTKLLAEVRNSSKVFVDGTLKFLYMDDNVISFARMRAHRRRAVIIFVNRSSYEQVIDSSKMELKDCSYYRTIHGDIIYGDRITLPPYSFAAFKVEMPLDEK
ncbi:glycoside hydrolase family 13 protein [Porcipelethomonas sp.]|uniref:glycoside hydrolase family 13 protein n=1 Tax=Porcipelethomonas sp. TaxID=2981675 RepID=UPI003EFA0C46